MVAGEGTSIDCSMEGVVMDEFWGPGWERAPKGEAVAVIWLCTDVTGVAAEEEEEVEEVAVKVERAGDGRVDDDDDDDDCATAAVVATLGEDEG